MKIAVASGKGGTGKTTIAVNLAYYISQIKKQKVQLLDCDVEAPNDDIFLNAHFTSTFEVTTPRPVWNKSLCTSCGKCSDICQYNAIAKAKNEIILFPELCHSCTACYSLCPQNALSAKAVSIGRIELSPKNTPFSFGHGVLKIGESLAPKVIKKLKEQIDDDSVNIIDAPPGTTCPVVAAIEGMDYCILVTEPTPFGLHDLKLAASLTEKNKIATGIIINRSYDDNTIIEDFAASMNIPIIGKIPFHKKYAQSYSRGEILIREFSEIEEIFSDIYTSILKNKRIPAKQKPRVEDVESNNFSPIQMKKGKNNRYKEMVVISGKGGTGKTTITSALSELMKNKILTDCDVDASNLYILCKPKIINSGNFHGGKIYSIDQDSCIQCGKCKEFCAFDAITFNNNIFEIQDLLCEGCGFCSQLCPVSSITSENRLTGKWFISETKQGPLSHARLDIGAENSGKLVSFVRDHAINLAQCYDADKILNDGPPGIGCPVISSITGADLALIITEPTLSGIHDMKRVLDLTNHFNIRSLIIINKFDLNEEISSKIINIADIYKTKVLGKIPFDKNMNDTLVNRSNIISYGKGEAYKSIIHIWNNLQKEFQNS